MAIAEDIKEILTEEFGAAFQIIRESGNVSGEYGIIRYTNQATKPITLEHFRRCVLPYDTKAVAGDIVDVSGTSERFIVTNKLPKLFGSDIISYDSIWYKCNVSSGELLRPSGETRDAQYHLDPGWETIKNNCDAMQVAALYGNDFKSEQEIALMGLLKNEVYLPKSVGVQVLDRWQPASGEYYQVSVIESRRFPGVDVLIVEEDNR